MRRILITDEIKRFAKDYSLKMEDEKNFRKGESPKARLLALCNQLKRFGTVVKILKKKASKGHPAVYTNYKGRDLTALSDYVQAIYDNYDGLNALLPSEWDMKISQKVDDKLKGYDIRDIKVKLPRHRACPFFELVVDAMRYDKVQSDIMPTYIRKLGIKTCVYCNAQFATTAIIQEVTQTKRGKLKTKTIETACYELDHNKAKSKYPYLCTNFYNLQPTCGSCNRRKNNQELNFSLYYEVGDTDVKPVHFALSHSDLINFRITNNGKGIKPYLCNAGTDTPPSVIDHDSIAAKFTDILGMQSVYDEYEDIVEEILWKHKIYSKGFMTATENQIKSLGIAGFDMKRFILGGYYGKEEDFLKRPLSIMKNDLWEQLERG